MERASEAPAGLAFGRFRVLPRRRELLAVDGQPIKLGGRAFDLLIALIEVRGDIVGKDALMARVWPDRVVDENNLRSQIAALRAAFGAERELIRTVSGRGYQFTGAIRVLSGSAYERAGAGMAAAQPAAGLPPTNLPELGSGLIGRDEELGEILSLAVEHRLITLTGPGGIGKTRLALAAARQILPHFADGVWLAEFSPLADPGLVPATVAAAAGLELGGGEASAQRVAQALADRPLLLVLDTCEHVIDAAAGMAAAVLRAGSAVQVIATSREPLRVEGEQIYPIPPLDAPAEDGDSGDHPLRYGAVRLFVERARAAQPHFVPDRRLAALIAAICRRLDGIPLAIELAAARAAALGIEEVISRLDDCFRLLTGGRRTALPRHQTLRATFDWSYELLSEPERVILRRLAVFAGTFSLKAARAVVASPEITPSEVVNVQAAGSVASEMEVGEADVIDGVASLVAKSLISTTVINESTYYRLLDTTRAYAGAKLAERGEADRIARRHAIFYSKFLEHDEIIQSLFGEHDLSGYASHIGNVRAALGWALSDRGDAAVGIELATWAAPLFVGLSLLEECRVWCERALAALDDASRGTRQEMILREALALSSMFTRGHTDQVRAAIERGLALAEAFQDRGRQLRLLAGLNLFLTRRGDIRGALVVAEQSGVIAQAAKHPAGTVWAEWWVGVAHHYLGNQGAAQLHCERGLALAAELGTLNANFFGFDNGINALTILVRALWLRGFSNQALRIMERAIDEAASRDHPVPICISLLHASMLSLWTGDLPRASDLIEQRRW
jgi:predicted ATPase/DNA-binding winged helix-turn-helix (wHTH) protein